MASATDRENGREWDISGPPGDSRRRGGSRPTGRTLSHRARPSRRRTTGLLWDGHGPGRAPVIRFGRYRLHPTEGLTRGAREIHLTQKALGVLRLLAERPGHLVTKDEIFDLVWAGVAVSDAALTSCIQELRRALDDDARAPRFIETLHRRGFRFLPQTSSPDDGGAPALRDPGPAPARVRRPRPGVGRVDGRASRQSAAARGSSSWSKARLESARPRSSRRFCRAVTKTAPHRWPGPRVPSTRGRPSPTGRSSMR